MVRKGEAKVDHAEFEFEFDPELGRRHIIKRPRLTRLLDESKSRIIMLVAPAGYGKTTLAREWLEDKPHAWYQATNASADVAALAAGVADALGGFVPPVPARLRERLRVSDSPWEDVQALVRTVAEDLDSWPESAWLVIDDYHLMIGSSAAEQFIDLLPQLGPIRLLLATRHRPPWATARRILYGEIFEVGRNLLAMSYDEGQAVLAHTGGQELPGLLSLAEGWPAVLGLAALSGKSGLPDEELPVTLYDYFAEEVYQSAFATIHEDLHYLALIPRLTVGVMHRVFGTRAPTLLEECGRLGLLTPQRGGELHLHPLLRRFLRHKSDPDDVPASVLMDVCAYYREEGAWDDALEAAAVSPSSALLIETFEAAYGDLVAEGRVQTLTKWIDESSARQVSAPIIDLASAEVAFRQGHVHKALALAERAAGQLAEGHASAPRGFRLAALAASRCDLFDRAFDLYTIARKVAVTPDDEWQAIWGLFISTVSLEKPIAEEMLHDLLKFEADSAELALRKAVAPYLYGIRFGTLAGTMTPLEQGEHLLEQSSDPLVRSAFLNFYAHRLVLGANYDEAALIVERQIEEATQCGIRFALAVGLATRGATEFGRRNLTLAVNSLDSADAIARTLSGGNHLAMNSAALRARIALARGRGDQATELLDRQWEQLPEPSMVGEYMATHALALVCSGDRRAAEELADVACSITRGVEARVLAEAVRAIAALTTARWAKAVQVFMNTVEDTGNVDGFVSAYRAHPPLLAAVNEQGIRHQWLQIVHRYDRNLARRVGIVVAGGSAESKLSKREREVFALLRRGMTNREIAHSLFISESTAKVHLRHILEKLGARSRTEAVAMGLIDEVD